MLAHWTVAFLGNLAGCLFIVAIITGFGGVFDPVEYKNEAITFATRKQMIPSWHVILLRGIESNWLACMAWFLGITGREGFSKIAGIWWPSFAFISLGLGHVVANMFFIPMALWHGAPRITVGLYIWKGIIPALIGNIIGGALFIGGYYWYQYLQGQSTILVDGILFRVPRNGARVGLG
jgi:formate/nitrite transporter